MPYTYVYKTLTTTGGEGGAPYDDTELRGQISELAENVVATQTTQPTNQYNRIWLNPDERAEYTIPTYEEFEELQGVVGEKQNTLVSGTNIKTVNGESILGEGDITVEGGSGGVGAKTVTITYTASDVGINTTTRTVTGMTENMVLVSHNIDSGVQSGDWTVTCGADSVTIEGTIGAAGNAVLIFIESDNPSPVIIPSLHDAVKVARHIFTTPSVAKGNQVQADEDIEIILGYSPVGVVGFGGWGTGSTYILLMKALVNSDDSKKNKISYTLRNTDSNAAHQVTYYFDTLYIRD